MAWGCATWCSHIALAFLHHFTYFMEQKRSYLQGKFPSADSNCTLLYSRSCYMVEFCRAFVGRSFIKNWAKVSKCLINPLFIYLFIYNNFICNNQYKKAAIREELNPHVRWPPKTPLVTKWIQPVLHSTFEGGLTTASPFLTVCF